jgi:hypothetical protein
MFIGRLEDQENLPWQEGLLRGQRESRFFHF